MGAVFRHLAAGLGLGLALGVVARGFMALLTEDPEFTWAGTAFIVGVFAVAGLCLAAAHALKLRGRSRWWKLLALPSLVLFFGPGMFLAPGVLGLALVGARSRWLRALGALAFVGFLALIVVETAGSEESLTVRTIAGFVVMTACCGALAVAARAALSGWTPDGHAVTSPRPAPVPGAGSHRHDLEVRAAG